MQKKTNETKKENKPEEVKDTKKKAEEPKDLKDPKKLEKELEAKNKKLEAKLEELASEAKGKVLMTIPDKPVWADKGMWKELTDEKKVAFCLRK